MSFLKKCGYECCRRPIDRRICAHSRRATSAGSTGRVVRPIVGEWATPGTCKGTHRLPFALASVDLEASNRCGNRCRPQQVAGWPSIAASRATAGYGPTPLDPAQSYLADRTGKARCARGLSRVSRGRAQRGIGGGWCGGLRRALAASRMERICDRRNAGFSPAHGRLNGLKARKTLLQQTFDRRFWLCPGERKRFGPVGFILSGHTRTMERAPPSTDAAEGPPPGIASLQTVGS